MPPAPARPPRPRAARRRTLSPRRATAAAAILAAAAGLAACAGGGSGLFGGPLITYDQQVSPYAPSFVRTAAQTGSFYVRILGEPFPGETPKEEIARRIPMPQWLGQVRATTMPGEEVNTNFFAILAFNPAFSGPLTDAACADPEAVPVQPPVAGTVRLAAGFCIGSRIGSYLVAQQEGIAGPDDPRFAAMLGQVMLALLPRYDPALRGDFSPFSFPQ